MSNVPESNGTIEVNGVYGSGSYSVNGLENVWGAPEENSASKLSAEGP